MKTVKNYSPKTKILSLILSFLIIFYLVPASVYAEGFAGDTTVSDNSVSENEENNTYTPEIYEVTELREENVKHFRLEDGSYVAAQYNYPVHYTDENGEFEDIDNRLVESGSEFSTNNSRVKFIKKITGNGNIFTLHENNTKITMGLAGAEKKTKGVVTSNHNSDDAIDDALGKMTNLENISSTILYEDILDGVDIEYIVHSLNIKENIIVKEKKDAYSYTFTLELNNLTVSLADNGNVYINSLDDETQYVIPAPVVFDANGIYAPDDASAYSLTEVGNGKYELNVSVNAYWMNAEERVYPVTIDPPMLSTDGNALDLNIDSNYPNSNTDGEEDFYVSSSKRAYVKFDENDFAEIPIGATLMKAELNIIGSNGSAPVAKVGAYEIVTNWDASLTWDKTLSPTLQGTFGDILDYVVIDSAGRHCWNITELYKRWLNGESNYGIGLKLLDETSDGSAYFTAYEYYPDIDDTNLYAPVIMVTYIYNDGLESYYPTSTHSVGVGGAGSINLSTGRLTLAIPTLTTTDYLFSFTPTLVYNSSLAGKSATSENVSSAFSTSYMANGFKLNIQETIVQSSYTTEDGANVSYYLLYDSDGSIHRFYYNWNDETYQDDDGLKLTLTPFKNSSNNSIIDYITIEDINQNIKTYSQASGGWHLTKITDKYGNELIFEFNTSYQPTKVIVKPNSQSNIEMLRLLYEGDKLRAVYNDSSKASVIFRYSNNNLAGVEYCYGNENTTEQNIRDTYNNSPNAANVTVYTTATYTYDDIGNIIKITDSDTNKSLQYEITNGKISKLSEYAGTTLGQQVAYTYSEGYTDLRFTGNDEILNTADDTITRYIFDGYGRSTSVYSMSANGAEIYGATTGSYETSEKAKNSLKESAVVYDRVENYLTSNNNGNYYATLQGGVDKTSETGCYKQTVFIEDSPETIVKNTDMKYVVSGFGYSNSVIHNDYAKFSLSVNVYYYQGEGIDDIVITQHFDFADVENTWQFTSGVIYCDIASAESTAYNVVHKIEVVCNYYGQIDINGSSSYAYFDKVAFTECSEGDTYRYGYDEKGNLVSKIGVESAEYYMYDCKNRVVKIQNNFGSIREYEYVESGYQTIHFEYYRKLIDSESSKLVFTNIYFYNEYGLLTNYIQVDSENKNNSVDLLSQVQKMNFDYTHTIASGSKIFGALVEEEDSLGHITKYFYDETNGNLLAQIDVSSGKGYVYSYDEMGVLNGVIPATGTQTSYNGVTNAESVSYVYNDATHRLSKIITDSTEYSFSYDSFGNSTGVAAGNNTLATYEYYPNNGKLKKINYGNGFSEDYVYNTLEMLSEIWYTYDDGTREKAYSYTYNLDGTLDVFTDHIAGKNAQYRYDNSSRLISIREKDIDETSYNDIYRVSYSGDNKTEFQTNIVSYSSTTSGISQLFTTSYSYDEKGNLATESLTYLSNEHNIDYVYDGFGRITSVTNDFGSFDYTKQYSYVLDEYDTSYQVSSYTSTVGTSSTTYNYLYSSRGNIGVVEQGGKEKYYIYDDLGQLTQEYDEMIVRYYTYDDAGNIISIKSDTVSSDGGLIMRAILPLPTISAEKTLAYTDSEWGDLLTSFNGTTITYDEIGNPLSYYNGSSYTFTWEGRRLVNAVKGSNTMSFTYDDNGIRTSKTVNGVTHTYQLNGNQIVSEAWGNNLIVYLYDASGAPIGMMYRTTSYDITDWDVFWFEKNLLGDIVAVYNSAGTKVVTYTYSDAWGNHSVTYSNGGASTGARYNPFRYRGYYYDTDLGMYYLQSRYYDSNTCRFINADGYVSTGQGLTGYNMFAYCGNNPVMGYDPTGHWDWGGVIVGALLTIAACVAAYYGLAATEVGMLVTGAVMATGLTMIATAATDSQMVMDVSGTAGAGLLFRGGGSIVIDFDKDESNFYYHGGNGLGYAFGIGYSVGVLENYNKPMDYAGDFIDVFGGYGLGADHGWSPEGEYATAPQSFSFTFSKGLGFGIGKDTYSDPIPIFKWGGN